MFIKCLQYGKYHASREGWVMNKIDTCVYGSYIWWAETNIKTNYVIINAVVIVFLDLLGCRLNYCTKETPEFNGSSNIDICFFFTNKTQPGYIVSALKIIQGTQGTKIAVPSSVRCYISKSPQGSPKYPCTSFPIISTHSLPPQDRPPRVPFTYQIQLKVPCLWVIWYLHHIQMWLLMVRGPVKWTSCYLPPRQPNLNSAARISPKIISTGPPLWDLHCEACAFPSPSPFPSLQTEISDGS